MTYEQVFTDLFNVSVAEFAVASSQGPFSMQDRYVTEDVPMGVTLTASLGRTLGVPTPTYDSIIHIASLVNETEYYKIGRNLTNLRLDGLTAAQLNAYVMTGRRPKPQTVRKKKATRPIRRSRAAGTRSKAPKRKGRK
jgi:opine dehydrogenase